MGRKWQNPPSLRPFPPVRSGTMKSKWYTDSTRSSSVASANRAAPGRRAYGTGTLRVVRGSWLASWYAADGRRVQRKVGDARTEGRSDGLTTAQAEKALRQLRESESPGAVARSRKVTMAEAGAELCRRLELKDRKSTRLNSRHTDISRMPASAWKENVSAGDQIVQRHRQAGFCKKRQPRFL